MEQRKYSKLRRRLVSIMAGFSLVPLAAVSLFLATDFQSTYRQKIENNLQSLAWNNKRAIDMFLEERAAQLMTLAATSTFAQLSDEAYLNEAFRVMQSSSSSLIDLGVINSDGVHAAYVGPYDLEGYDYSDQEWFHETLLKGVYVSDVFMGFRRYPHFIIAVTRREGGNLWILRATINSEVFDNLVQGSMTGENGDAFLVNADNVLQTGSRFNGDVLETAPLGRHEFFTGVRPEDLEVDGRAMMAGLVWLETTKWMLVIMEDPAEEMSPLFRTKSLLVILALCGVAVIFAGAAMTSAAICKRLRASDMEKAALDSNLMQSSKMAALGKLAAGVAHEVNNPLTLIREGAGWLKDLLEDEHPGKMESYGEFKKGLDMIEHHVDRAKEVTHRMLGFGRRMEPVQEHVDLNAVAEQTLKFLDQEALHRSIVIERDFKEGLPPVTTDMSQLQQVILNVVDNAVDAVDRNGSIRVITGLDEGGKEVFLSVVDSGPGMPHEVMQKIFDPFYTTKSVGEGTGLGLAICYSIMEKLGGRIDVESQPGMGSVFTIRIPLESAAGR